MISIEEAFAKFKSRLELTDSEQKDASRKQQAVRSTMDSSTDVQRDFLTGSYARHTKTKPLKDVDIFVVLGEEEFHWKSKEGKKVLDYVKGILDPIYGKNNVSLGRRSVQIKFRDSTGDENEKDEDVLSIDVVPAFEIPEGYLIPCTFDGWVKTNPDIHKNKATEVNKAYDLEWKPMVKMVKKWNEFHQKPIKPSFLIEVMALELLRPPFKNGYLMELKFFFASLSARVGDKWDDPARLGPPVSDQMDAERVLNAKKALKLAELQIQKAMTLKEQGKSGEALRVLRNDVFGPKFPLS
jgi:hypothetical protein